MVAVNACRPSVSGIVGVQVKAPAALAVAVQTVMPSIRTVTIAFAGAVPLSIGVVVFTIELSAGSVTTGAPGATTEKVLVFEGSDMFPAGSTAIALTVWLPSMSAIGTSNVHVPSGRTVAIPTGMPSTRTVMVLPGSPVPVTVGVVSDVTLPLAGPVTAGVRGGVESTVKLVGALAGDVRPPMTATAVATWGPSERAMVGVQLNAPLELAVVVHAMAPSMRTVTMEFGGAVPVTGGRVLVVVLLLVGAVMTGAVGPAFGSTVNVLVFDGIETFPAASVAVAFTV